MGKVAQITLLTFEPSFCWISLCDTGEDASESALNPSHGALLVPHPAPRNQRQERRMGHKSLATTQRYMHLSPATFDDMADVLAQYSEGPRLRVATAPA